MSLHVAGEDGQWHEVTGVTNVQPTFRPELWADTILNAQAQTYVALFTSGTVPQLTRRQRLVRAIQRPFRRLAWSVDAFVDEWRSW